MITPNTRLSGRAKHLDPHARKNLLASLKRTMKEPTHA